mmetsp:Transcript_69862/g.145682  ORF Transcript_69862/g.145682 Transcript_69862/m.145682 type:complete len:295 (-) Transcript_69862:346-1230(-)|eukprot:CAMPEP_0181331052 /NCGR_PEP_ID=MMETSP1101-20121128/24272_1 /TAXON_ID=46948 /ORGANISM="Rhodomonas abbreviata, Strain Caron Lab Isolate" /LENGTH=294 /DNA_ID=CAMNT_0023440439 /DNA_START=165 /DNA_END=1049 /DNA_ORIENTATION=+
MQTRSSPNLQTLHSLAKQVSVPDYEKLSKEALFAKLKEKFNIERLLRTEARQNRALKKRKHDDDAGEDEDEEEEEEGEGRSSSSSKKQSTSTATRKREKINTIDPIMLVPITKKSCFKFMRPNGSVIRFNINSLVDYLLASGDFSDPETRIPFSDADLTEIDAIAKKNKLQKASVVEAKKNTATYTESKFHRDALLALERCAGEVVTDILEIIEECDPDEAQMQLIMREFPSFVDYYRQLREADRAYASKCLAHWKLFMQGPTNRPNVDHFGLIAVTCHFFTSCEQSSGNDLIG